MADGRQLIATPSVLIELREERQVIRDGYRFLDEKCLLLAAEILHQLDEYEQLQRDYLQLHRTAAAALADAVARHGLEGLQVHPQLELEDAVLRQQPRRFLGVRLTECRLELHEHEPAAAVDPSPEARRCAHLFRELVQRSAILACYSGNLERLLQEYRRTERRARALEDVLLPELERSLTEIVVRLEEMDQEEAVRVRLDYGKR
jgi:V/A-type H+-transporting ATPase subunit D